MQQNNIEIKLQELNKKYKKLENGSYYVKLGNGNELYIPNNVDSYESLLAYAPGAGGSGNDAVNIRKMCEGQNPPSCAVVIAPVSADEGNILELATNTINNLGGQVDNVVYASFSAGSVTGIRRSNEYLQKHPDTSLSIISCDGYNNYRFLEDKFPAIKESQTPFIILTGEKDYSDRVKTMHDYGYNAYYLKADKKRWGHVQLNKDMIDNLLLYALGETDEIPANECNYQLYKGDLTTLVDLSNIRCEGAGVIAGYDKNKYKKALSFSALSFSNLDKYQDGEKIGNGYVKSDFNFISTSLNEIRSTISKANIATKTPTLPIAGADGLLSAISTCIEKYSNMTVNLYSKLAQETEATASYAQSIINLDLSQKGQLTNINSDVNTSQIQNTDNNNNNNYNNNQNTTATPLNTNTSTQYSPVNNNNVETTSNNQNTNTNAQNNNYYSKPLTAAAAAAGPIMTTQQTTNPVIDGNNITWKYSDGHNLILTVENNKVTSMKFTYSYNSVDELNKNINNILVGEIDKSYIDKMTIIDKSVEVTIKEEYFKNLSLDKIKELFFKGGIN